MQNNKTKALCLDAEWVGHPKCKTCAVRSSMLFADLPDSEQRAAGFFLKRARHFLNGKHDARQWRIKRRRHARSAPGHNQAVLGQLARQAYPAPDGIQNRRAYLHRQPLAPDTGAAARGYPAA